MTNATETYASAEHLMHWLLRNLLKVTFACNEKKSKVVAQKLNKSLSSKVVKIFRMMAHIKAIKCWAATETMQQQRIVAYRSLYFIHVFIRQLQWAAKWSINVYAPNTHAFPTGSYICTPQLSVPLLMG